MEYNVFDRQSSVRLESVCSKTSMEGKILGGNPQCTPEVHAHLNLKLRACAPD